MIFSYSSPIELALQLGTMFSVSEGIKYQLLLIKLFSKQLLFKKSNCIYLLLALKVGLIDEVVQDMPTGMKVAQAHLSNFLKIPGTFCRIKNSLIHVS